MSSKDSKLNFNNQHIYIGLDVHKTSLQVTLRSGNIVLKTFRMEPSVEELVKYLHKDYPGAEYISSYEAGFSGYWAHRQLQESGVRNIVVAPNAIPSTGWEKVRKSDSVDSSKIARELEGGKLTGIYVPSLLQQEFRSLLRLREQLVRSNVRTKNQIKSYLNFCGHKIPEDYKTRHWSRKFIEHLRGIKFAYEIGTKHLHWQLEELIERRSRIVAITKQIREYCVTYGMQEIVEALLTIPGFGFITTVTMLSEIMDINRFGKFDELAAYVGLAPAVQSSGERERNLGIMKIHNRKLRKILIEAAWIAVRQDPALTSCYNGYIKRMSKQRAIIKIAKKLLNRMRGIWKKRGEYVMGVIS